ncbi:MAG TPA: TnpV protein [Subdoligranulum variabile]|uniref:TnpV protein n=1 Tax=Subdoligranulum variabile TaxID=214851 RepID=A0A921LMW1_9FIRM|nr:TnpV protein [Subdoligranulum variabile]
MKLTYTEINGYLIPDLVLPETDTRPIGKYGELRRQFLREQRPDLFDLMLLEGTLHSHLADADAEARQMLEDTITRMARQQGVDEALKQADPLAWAGRMNAIKNAAEEAVLPDLLYGEAQE